MASRRWRCCEAWRSAAASTAALTQPPLPGRSATVSMGTKMSPPRRAHAIWHFLILFFVLGRFSPFFALLGPFGLGWEAGAAGFARAWAIGVGWEGEGGEGESGVDGTNLEWCVDGAKKGGLGARGGVEVNLCVCFLVAQSKILSSSPPPPPRAQGFLRNYAGRSLQPPLTGAMDSQVRCARGLYGVLEPKVRDGLDFMCHTIPPLLNPPPTHILTTAPPLMHCCVSSRPTASRGWARLWRRSRATPTCPGTCPTAFPACHASPPATACAAPQPQQPAAA
jgi:hypothetical protein